MALRLKLVKNWRKSWRWLSVQLQGLSAALTATWLALPPDMQSAIRADYALAVALTLAVAGLLGRLVDQGPEDDA